MPMTDMDRVRLEIGDSFAPMHFSDAEIWEKISQAGGTWKQAAAELCFIWARWLGRQPSFTLGSFSEGGAQAAATLLNEKGKELLAQVLASNSGLYAGGISEADVETSQQDTDRVQPYFKAGMLANPDAGEQEGTS